MAEIFNKGRPNREQNRDTLRTNTDIVAKEVEVINEQGEKLGIFSRKEALEMAESEGLDLVEFQADRIPPICKILDYKKFIYDKTKQQGKNKNKKNKALKELYIHLGIAEHDFQVKFRHLESFLKDGYKVKIGVKLRGREIAYAKKGLELLERFYNDLDREKGAKLEVPPKVDGNNVVTIFAPVNKPSEKVAKQERVNKQATKEQVDNKVKDEVSVE